jgi:hypothetical protein
VFSHTVNALQLVEYLELHAMLEEAIRVILRKARGLLSVQVRSQLQNRCATRNNSLGRPLVPHNQCPQRRMR